MEQIVNAPPDNLAATNIGIRSWEGEFRVLEAEFKVGIDEGNAEWIQEMAELGCRVEELQGVSKLSILITTPLRCISLGHRRPRRTPRTRSPKSRARRTPLSSRSSQGGLCTSKLGPTYSPTKGGTRGRSQRGGCKGRSAGGRIEGYARRGSRISLDLSAQY